MALRVWLPLNGTLENIGVSGITMSGTPASWGNGKIGKCATFSGNVNQRLTSNQTNELDYTDNFSWCMWVNPNYTSGSTQYVFTVGRADGTTYGYGANIPSATSLTCRFGSSTWGVDVASNEWTHVAFTKQGTSIKIYKNGELKINQTFSGTLPEFTQSLGLGLGYFYYSGGNIYPFYGSLNDFRIYDHCLSPKEVKEISQGLVLHYKLDGWSGGSGRNIALKSNNGNFGSTDELKTITFTGWDNYAQHNLNLTASEWNSLVGKKVTYTCYINNIEQTVGTGTGIMIHFRYADGTYTQYGGGKNGVSGSYFAQGESGLARLTVTVPDPTTRSNPTTITHVQYSVRHNSNTGASTVEYQHAQVEIGDTPTTWSWAPEDLGIDTTKITDSSGYGNDGTILSNPYINSDASRYQISTYFDGVDDGILIENLTLSSIINDQVSYSFWIKPQGENGARSVYFGSYSSTSWSIEKTTGNVLRLYWNGSPDETCSGATITNDIWQHIVITKNGANNIKVYINGVQKWTSTAAHNTLSFPTTYRIGRDTRTGDGTPYHGLMSDFRIYATALSAEDILDLYHTPANIDNLGGLHGFEFIDNINNRIMEANGTIATKNWNNSTLLKNYQQTNCQVTLTDDGLRIYRPPNYNPTDNGNTMWGGMRINNTRDGGHPIYGSGDNPIGLEKGHTYIIAFHVKGKSSNATNNHGWSNQMGWGGGGLGPTPTDVSYDLLPSNFNGEKECWYKWTINDDIVKTCTTSYSYAVAGNQYMSYADFAFGWQYQDTGALGSDVYITNLRLYDITNLDMSNIQKNGIINFTQLDELAQTNKASITFYKELQASNFIEK